MSEQAQREHVPAPGDPSYEPPLVEKVMSADELAREVNYAGSVQVSE